MDAREDGQVWKATDGPQRSWPYRAYFGLLGVAAVVGALFVTGLALFAFAMAADCNGPSTSQMVVEGGFAGGFFGVAATLAWLVAVSFLRVSAGRRGLRARSWIAVPVLVGVLSVVYVGVAVAQQPPPSPSCQPFEMS